MKMTVLGIQAVDYVSKKSGRPVKGLTLHCSHCDQAVEGLMVESVYISDNLDCYREICSVRPKDVIDVQYNNRGYVAEVSKVPFDQSPAKK